MRRPGAGERRIVGLRALPSGASGGNRRPVRHRAGRTCRGRRLAAGGRPELAGGAAQVLAEKIKSVDGLYLEEFGLPEAIWELSVEDFPVVVTMDSHGNSLHKEVEAASKEVLKSVL